MRESGERELDCIGFYRFLVFFKVRGDVWEDVEKIGSDFVGFVENSGGWGGGGVEVGRLLRSFLLYFRREMVS